MKKEFLEVPLTYNGLNVNEEICVKVIMPLENSFSEYFEDIWNSHSIPVEEFLKANRNYKQNKKRGDDTLSDEEVEILDESIQEVKANKIYWGMYNLPAIINTDK